MLAGYLFERFRILKRGSSEILSGFVFLVSLPALIFISLARVPVGEFFNWPFLGALGGGMLAMFAISLLIARTVFPESLTANGLHALAATFSSTGYVGLPLVLIVFGETVLVPGIIGVVLPVALLMPLAIIIAEADKCRDGGRILQASLRGLIRNPMIVATIAGLLVSWSGIFIPEAIANGFQLLGDAFIPCSLFSAGLFMAGATVKGERVEVGWVVLTKLVLHPLLTFWLAYWLNFSSNRTTCSSLNIFLNLFRCRPDELFNSAMSRRLSDRKRRHGHVEDHRFYSRSRFRCLGFRLCNGQESLYKHLPSGRHALHILLLHNPAWQWQHEVHQD